MYIMLKKEKQEGKENGKGKVDGEKAVRSKKVKENAKGDGKENETGGQDHHKPFFISLFRTRSTEFAYHIEAIKLPKIIVCLAKVSLIWEFVFYSVTVSTFIMISYAAFFAYYDETLWNFVFYTDVIFSFDVIVRLVVEIWRQQSKKQLVVFTTPYTLSQFLLDIIAILPTHQLFIWVEGTKNLSRLSLIDFCRFNRFIRLGRTWQFFKYLLAENPANEKIVFLFSFSNLYIGFIHVVSCILFFLTQVAPLDFLLNKDLDRLSDTWLADFQQKKINYGSEPFDLFIIATHFSVAVVTTVGYGDLFPTNESEMAVCIFIMLIGAIFLSGYFSSQLTNFELETDGARFDLFFRLAGIKKTLVEVDTLPLYNARVEEYYRFLWTYREGVDKVAFLSELPVSFQEDLQYDICQEMFDKSFLLHGLDEAFLRAVSKIVQVALFNPNMLLCRHGGYANKMFYILQGECRVVSKYDMSKPAGILRAGFLIGEANLFFSFPYTTSVETRTCCQFLIVEKEELMKVFDQFGDELFILRSRAQAKSRDMYVYYKKAGQEAIAWVEAKDEPNRVDRDNPLDRRLSMRWGYGLCAKVTEDVIDDTKEPVIFEKSASDKGVQKNHLTPYMTCVVPEIMDSEMEFVKYWNMIIMIASLIYAFIGPYCLAFGESNELEKLLCSAKGWFEVPNAILFTVDVFVEIIAACPVYGLYYKFVDGFQLKKTEAMFYFDLLAGIPFELFYGNTNQQDLLHTLNVLFKAIKLWKVIRYLNYLDNKNPMDLFWFRLGQTCLSLVYGIHFIACIFYLTACPVSHKEFREAYSSSSCKPNSWLGSYAVASTLVNETVPPEYEYGYLASDRPYLLSFFFSSATLTSAGFGDFNPQNKTEMYWACLFQLIGFFLIGYYTSLLTSALSCGVRPKLAFQQKLVSIQQFMNHHHLRESLQDRIVEHYFLQDQFRGGISLPHDCVHFMYDAPDFLKNDVLYLEVYKLLEGIPVFTKCEVEAMVQMSARMTRFVVPPNTAFIHRGEVRRVMYLIKFGSVGIIDDETNKPIDILESSAHFGIRDMLFGEPCHFTVMTLSDVCLYSITYEQMRTVFTNDEDLLKLIDSEKKILKPHIEEMTNLYANFTRYHQQTTTEEKPRKIPAWIPISRNPEDESNQEFQESLEKLNLGTRLMRCLLMSKTIHPVGAFANFWICVISIVSSLSVTCLFLETFMLLRTPYFRFFEIVLDIFCYVDIYLKMHWSYYIPGSWILITSPVYTFMCYILNGSFASDVIFCVPFELVTFLTGETNILGYGRAASWYSRIRWPRLFQVKRVANIFQISHNVFVARNYILLIVYVSVTLLVCTIVGAVSLYVGCPWFPDSYAAGDEYKLPLCLEETWITKKIDPSVTANLLDRWIAGVYYVSQVVLVIGFGDMITLSTSELMILIFMSVFGFIFMRCVIADITAAEVDSDEIRANYIEQLTSLRLVMARENVNKKLIMSVVEYLDHSWNIAKGLQPDELFADLHPALTSDLYRGVIRDRLFTVPILADFQPNIIRALCQCMQQMYFVKGQRLMRCDNLEYEMHIIVEGRVWITDKDLNYVCSLTYGESYGEASLIYGVRRSYNAIASCNVVVYVLTAEKFSNVKLRYPVIQDLFEEKIKPKQHSDIYQVETDEHHDVTDLFVKKVTLRQELIKLFSQEDKKAEERSCNYEKKLIDDAISTKEHIVVEQKENRMIHEIIAKRILEYVFGMGSHDDNLPLIYLATSGSSKSIHPNCTVMSWFLTAVYFLCYITPALAMYELSFAEEFLLRLEDPVYLNQRSVRVTRLIYEISDSLEIIMLLYIVSCFVTAIESQRGYYIKDNKSIALTYLLSLTGFLLDFLSSLPYIVGFVFKHTSYYWKSSRHTKATIRYYLGFLRLLRPYRFYNHELSKKDDLNISTFRYKMTISISLFCLMAHVLACIFYVNSSCNKDANWKPDTNPCQKYDEYSKVLPSWTYVFSDADNLWKEDYKMSAWRWWVRSMYWVVTVISTTGFGDISPQKISEMTIAIVCIFCGAFVLSIILSNFTAGMASITKFHRAYLYQVKLLVKHLRNIGLSQYRQDQVMSYFLMVWESSRGISYNKAAEILPITMQIEVCYALYVNVLQEVHLFHLRDPYMHHTLLRQISLRLTHSYYIPGVCIVKEGDKGDSLFVVFKGQVSGTTPQRSGIELPNLQKVYSVGHVFGRFPALFRADNLEESYKKSYRAEVPTEILELKQHDILHLTESFPAFLKSLLAFIRKHYDGDGTSQPIFMKSSKKRAGLFELDLEYQVKAAKPKKRRDSEPMEKKKRRESKKPKEVKKM